MLLERLKEILNSVNSDYTVVYEEASAMNVRADNFKLGRKLAYIEEFKRGTYSVKNYLNKTTKLQIYFCIISEEIDSNAEKREAIRVQIEEEIVEQFIRSYNACTKYFFPVENWNFYTPMPRFDSFEVSVMLEFDCKLKQVC